jgi:hypothetical protein
MAGNEVRASAEAFSTGFCHGAHSPPPLKIAPASALCAVPLTSTVIVMHCTPSIELTVAGWSAVEETALSIRNVGRVTSPFRIPAFPNAS